MKIASTAALSALDQADKVFVELFRHGSLSVEIYRPEKEDLQKPHERDEIYVVLSGTGKFENQGIVSSFGPGDVLFVPAYAPHRFVEFTEDFATWVFFYGPKGGEAPVQEVNIKNWEPAFKDAFFQLNKAWIEVDYPLEQLDIDVLSHPEIHILDKGGSIIAALVGDEVAGVVALRPFGENSMELTKMAVDNKWRGRGIGEKLMYAILDVAREKGVPKVVLFSNSITSAIAVNLYFKVGFKEVPLEAGVYKRANIKMEFTL
ncbi:MAG: GNAT family N-acetyltransferase [Saprospiraceae bacterium]|nr:GNAT family N-acetyltransferase [Saprospiraceae bacterium]